MAQALLQTLFSRTDTRLVLLLNSLSIRISPLAYHDQGDEAYGTFLSHQQPLQFFLRKTWGKLQKERTEDLVLSRSYRWNFVPSILPIHRMLFWDDQVSWGWWQIGVASTKSRYYRTTLPLRSASSRNPSQCHRGLTLHISLWSRDSSQTSSLGIAVSSLPFRNCRVEMVLFSPK